MRFPHQTPYTKKIKGTKAPQASIAQVKPDERAASNGQISGFVEESQIDNYNIIGE